MKQLARTSTVKWPSSNCMCICVCVGLRTYVKMPHCYSWKPKQGMVLTSELNKERRWNNDEFSWESNCCLSLDVPQLSFEWVGNLCACVPVCLWLSLWVMMETVSFFWSCALHIVIHTMYGAPLLVWWENRHQSPVASDSQLLSFFELWKVFIHFFWSP